MAPLSATRGAPQVRAVYGVTQVGEGATGAVQFRVDFPAAPPDPSYDPATGLVPPDPARVPMPLVVLHHNFNCGMELYGWLARVLALAGFAVVRFQQVAPLFGGRPGLTTGIDLSLLTPDRFGTHSPHAVLESLVAAVGALPDLHGAVDVDRVVLGGHSAGGTLALMAAHPAWHRGVCGAFSYGGHTRAQSPQGFGTDAYLPLPGGAPLLLMGGTADGVVGAIAQRQGHADGTHPMQATYERSVPDGTSAYLVLVDGADHYAFAEGYDGSTGRGYLENPGPADPAAVRALLGRLVVDFVRGCVDGDLSAVDRFVDAPPDGVVTSRRSPGHP